MSWDNELLVFLFCFFSLSRLFVDNVYAVCRIIWNANDEKWRETDACIQCMCLNESDGCDGDRSRIWVCVLCHRHCRNHYHCCYHTHPSLFHFTAPWPKHRPWKKHKNIHTRIVLAYMKCTLASIVARDYFSLGSENLVSKNKVCNAHIRTKPCHLLILLDNQCKWILRFAKWIKETNRLIEKLNHIHLIY